MLPVDANKLPTGIELLPKSDSVLLTENDSTFSVMSAKSLGENSIRSKVVFFLFIVSTTILIPRINSSSLNIVFEFSIK